MDKEYSNSISKPSSKKSSLKYAQCSSLKQTQNNINNYSFLKKLHDEFVQEQGKKKRSTHNSCSSTRKNSL
jgi:hypothetical protein